ncbi:hypothetical protein SCHPADRAFT_910400 [Schizopora paradoxa]|uniref:tRNA-specific adenosine deaminase 1 n=1 Tax=Schizopora paradoxa TaxID=27342 RepID=A0A0H2RNC0_9AGAM|nr:hypothetical protein SCHPADRAFT_910400 [Schizopora paradoxa]
MDASQVDELVSRVHAQYDALRFKPSSELQFTVLAAFVLSKTSYDVGDSGSSESTTAWKVISIATGSKCLPTEKYPVKGDALHDSHAEVLSRRGAVRWTYEEIRRCLHTASGSAWIERRETDGKWAMKEGVKLHMYVSTVPCGDASMRYLASGQDPAMAALKDSSPPALPTQGSASRGRDNYALFGVLRTKPGRADSPPTRCMSCSDKIAAWSILGVQGALLAQMFEPLCVDDIVIGLGDVEESDEVLRAAVREDCDRAFFGRLGDDIQARGYRKSTPRVLFTSIDFVHSRSSRSKANGKPCNQSSNESLCWWADSETPHEVLINGVRRGVGAKLRGLELYRPRLCKVAIFRLHAGVMELLRRPKPKGSYHICKQSNPDYGIVRKALKGPDGPFHGWVISGVEWESFDVDGNIVPNTSSSESEGHIDENLNH